MWQIFPPALSAKWKVAVRVSAWRAYSTPLCASMRAVTRSATISASSSFCSSLRQMISEVIRQLTHVGIPDVPLVMFQHMQQRVKPVAQQVEPVKSSPCFRNGLQMHCSAR